ncbi:carbon catabolite repressor protein, putative [Perkinsus marinus ATCC 50983]|uniref:Carbon catabolite repressor protein, putative n=1 Tax=Perkinsus marinus (strain ATCC 50983 / TXsc) TaxID=423536 RepID=C5L2Z2_PERM5|nr:carbon catabolite repressor protein, putative [Perkinsus marinus ATCC 50983]EER08879.1 carbon catabolite repressor protein, putative [Perkinsus marinus ATCC 50983]|eukprot:XP_002777063.1 carbon catabolite repressor protein, putative [Perkinsus marinus ATCC 50983]
MSQVQHLKVMQYNILGRHFAFSKYFSYAWPYLGGSKAKNFCPAAKDAPQLPTLLDWNMRLPMLVKTCLDSSADILCLCEMDSYEDFRQALGSYYDGYFAPRAGGRDDGSAIFWRRSILKLMSAKTLHYTGGSERVAAICRLQNLYGQTFTVVGTHLYWKGSCPTQSHEVDELTTELRAILDRDEPVILCGDLNNHRDSDTFMRIRDCGMEDGFTAAGLKPPRYTSLVPPSYVLSSRSGSYRLLPGREDEIDYIFVGGQSSDLTLKVVDAVAIDSRNDETGNGVVTGADSRDSSVAERGIPNMSHASDHLPVMCEVELTGP